MKIWHSVFLTSAVIISAPMSSAYAGTRAGSMSHDLNASSSKGGNKAHRKQAVLNQIGKFPPGLIGKCFNPDFPGAKGIEKVCARKSEGT